MPPKFLQFAPELPQFTYLLLVQCLISSRCKPVFINPSCLPLVPSSASDLGTDVNGSLTYNTKSSSHVHLPHRLAPGHPDLQPQTRGADGAAPKEKTRIWGMGREMYREKSRKLDPKVCDEIKNRTALLPCYYIIFLQVRKNICHK